MRNRLKEYLNQSALWESAVGKDAFSQTQYAQARKIAVRSEQKVRVVQDSMGNQVVSNRTYFCMENVRPLDRVDGGVALCVSEWVDKYGEVCGTEVCV